MKIISKSKDFYDYLVSDYDADIVYVRNPKWCGDHRLRSLYMKTGDFWWRQSDSSDKLPYSDPIKRWNTAKVGDLMVGSIVFGVYPFVYSTPIIKIFGKADFGGEDVWRYPEALYISSSFLDNLKNEPNIKTRNKMISDLVMNYIKSENKNSNTFYRDKFDETVTYNLTKHEKDNVPQCIEYFAAKVECPEIFKSLGSPVFIEENDLIDFYHTPFPEKDKDKKSTRQYLVDLSFNSLDPNIIKFWYTDLCDLNTYNNIENFLWSIKQEPQSEQTNNEKILSHGFDLKTSFRKM